MLSRSDIDKKKNLLPTRIGSFDYEPKSGSRSKGSNLSLDPGTVCKSLRRIGIDKKIKSTK